MKNIKVVFAIPGAVLGGVERHLARQLRYFDRAAFDISILIVFGEGGVPPGLFPGDVHVYRSNLGGFKDIGGLLRLARLLRDINPDIVVSSAFNANAVFRVLKPFFRYTALPREHNLYPDKRFMHRLADRLLSYCSPTVVAVSEAVADASAESAGIPRRKFTVIQNGIDLAEVQSFKAAHPDLVALKRSLGYEGRRVMMTVGRLRPQKNHKLMIRAFAKFKRESGDRDFLLAIVGAGGEKDALVREAKERGVEAGVRFAESHLPFEHYRIADFFLLTSEREGFPNVVLEALAFGVPVISSPLPGVVECVQNGINGYIAGAAENEFATALTKAAALDERALQGMRAECVKVAEEYRMEKNVHRYEELFRKLRGA